MTFGGALKSADEKTIFATSRRDSRYEPRCVHQQNPTTADPHSIRQMPISTGPSACVTRSSRMNDVPQTNEQNKKASCATAARRSKGAKATGRPMGAWGDAPAEQLSKQRRHNDKRRASPARGSVAKCSNLPKSRKGSF